MRIVHTSLRYPPALGGAEIYAQQIIERTRNIDQGRDVRVLTTKLKSHELLSELDGELLLDDPIYVQRLHHLAVPFISYPRLQALRYYIGHHQPDILEAYGFWYHPAAGAARYARTHHVPLILHPLYYEDMIRQKVIWQLYKKTLGRQIFAAADVVVVISPFEQSLIKRAGFDVKRFELIPPGVDIEKFQRPRLNPFLKRKIIGPILLAVGRIAAGKGLADIVGVLPDILQKNPDAQLAIAGEDFGAKEDLVMQVNKLDLTKRVHWLGKLPEEELIAAYQHAAIFVHPSHYEAFGIVLAEAQAAGVPVVARNATAIPFVVLDKQTGLLFKTREELAKNVMTLLENQRQRQQFAQIGRKHVAANFSWERSIAKLLAIYNELRPK